MASCHFGSVEAEGAMGIGVRAILGFFGRFWVSLHTDFFLFHRENNSITKSKDKEK